MNVTALLKKMESINHISNLAQKFHYPECSDPIYDSQMCHYMYFSQIHGIPQKSAQCGSHECSKCIFQEYHPHKELCDVIIQIKKATES